MFCILNSLRVDPTYAEKISNLIHVLVRHIMVLCNSLSVLFTVVAYVLGRHNLKSNVDILNGYEASTQSLMLLRNKV